MCVNGPAASLAATGVDFHPVAGKGVRCELIPAMWAAMDFTARILSTPTRR